MKLFLFCVLAGFATKFTYAQCNCSGSSSAVSFGENSSAELTMQKGKLQAEIFGDYRSFKNNDAPHDHSTHSHANGSVEDSSENELKSMMIGLGGLRYGLTNRVTLSVQQPDVWLNTKPTSTNGLGDMMIVSTVKFMDREKFTAGLLAGLELPTGKKSPFTDEANLAIGSGSIDFVGGIVLIKPFTKSFVRINAFYKHSTGGYNETQFGDFFSHSVSFGYKLNNTKSCSADSLKSKLSVNLFSSIAGEWNGEQIRQNIVNANTGGYTLLLQAGTLFRIGKWSIPLSFSIPVMQELKGEQSKTTLRTRIGLTKTF